MSGETGKSSIVVDGRSWGNKWIVFQLIDLYSLRSAETPDNKTRPLLLFILPQNNKKTGSVTTIDNENKAPGRGKTSTKHETRSRAQGRHGASRFPRLRHDEMGSSARCS
jgi:hypothetical protein